MTNGDGGGNEPQQLANLKEKVRESVENVVVRAGDRELERKWPGWHRFKVWIDGKKSILGLLLVLSPDVWQGLHDLLVEGTTRIGVAPTAAVRSVGLLFLVIGLAHKAYKVGQRAHVFAPSPDRREGPRRLEDVADEVLHELTEPKLPTPFPEAAPADPADDVRLPTPFDKPVAVKIPAGASADDVFADVYMALRRQGLPVGQAARIATEKASKLGVDEHGA